MIEAHSEESGEALERVGAREAAKLLLKGSPPAAAEVLHRTAPSFAAEVIAALPRDRAGEVVAAMKGDLVGRFLRAVPDEALREVVDAVPEERRGAIERSLSFPPETAGAFMDPRVFGLPADITVADALARIRRSPEHARYNVYLTDRDQRLIGVLNLRELMLARPRDLLADAMKPAIHRLRVDADRHALVSHPGWRHVHALPVVDGQGLYLGAVRYRTLRRLEGEILGAADRDRAGVTTRALGELFSTGVEGLMQSVLAERPRSEG